MDAFESVVSAILQRQGFWTITSAKVELTKNEKREIGRHSSPRWELDIVAYRGSDNTLRVVECKSYLDSPGVDVKALIGNTEKAKSRYKLFVEPVLRKVVLRRLVEQLVTGGFCAARPEVQLCLAAGKVNGDEAQLRSHFEAQGWLLLGPEGIREELRKLKEAGYENSVAAVVSKLLLRDGKPARMRKGIDAAV